MSTEQSDVDIFLAHYGVLGMKWGVRRDFSRARNRKKERNEKKYGGKDKKKRTAAQKRARGERNVKRVNNAVAAASVAIFLARLFALPDAPTNERAGPRSNFSNYTKPSKSVQDLINSERDVKISAIDKTFREGFIDETQRKQFIDKMNNRYDRKLKDALD